jgi:hypothetical protein
VTLCSLVDMEESVASIFRIEEVTYYNLIIIQQCIIYVNFLPYPCKFPVFETFRNLYISIIFIIFNNFLHATPYESDDTQPVTKFPAVVETGASPLFRCVPL